jgi:hypothetical protein
LQCGKREGAGTGGNLFLFSITRALSLVNNSGMIKGPVVSYFKGVLIVRGVFSVLGVSVASIE